MLICLIFNFSMQACLYGKMQTRLARGRASSPSDTWDEVKMPTVACRQWTAPSCFTLMLARVLPSSWRARDQQRVAFRTPRVHSLPAINGSVCCRCHTMCPVLFLCHSSAIHFPILEQRMKVRLRLGVP